MRLLANLAWLLTMGDVDLMPVASRQEICSGNFIVFCCAFEPWGKVIIRASEICLAEKDGLPELCA